MEQSSQPQYLLRNGLLVGLTEKMEMSFTTIERAVMSFYSFTEELNEEHGIAIWCDMNSGQRRYISSRDAEQPADELTQLAESFGCQILDLMNDPSVAQDLIKDMGLHVSAVTFRDGSLEGVWRVERISNYMPWNQDMNGIITGVNQPVATESKNILHAIYATACRVMGLGKMAFIHFPAGAEGGAEVIATDFELTPHFSDLIGQTVFRAPELDKYVTSSLPDNVKIEAVAVARAQCRAVLAPVAEEDSQANNPAPEIAEEPTGTQE